LGIAELRRSTGKRSNNMPATDMLHEVEFKRLCVKGDCPSKRNPFCQSHLLGIYNEDVGRMMSTDMPQELKFKRPFVKGGYSSKQNQLCQSPTLTCSSIGGERRTMSAAAMHTECGDKEEGAPTELTIR
jgi:hypothetical protein